MWTGERRFEASGSNALMPDRSDKSPVNGVKCGNIKISQKQNPPFSDSGPRGGEDKQSSDSQLRRAAHCFTPRFRVFPPSYRFALSANPRILATKTPEYTNIHRSLFKLLICHTARTFL